jgi:hypothetical protein
MSHTNSISFYFSSASLFLRKNNSEENHLVDKRK